MNYNEQNREQNTTREQIEHQNMLVDIRNVLTTKSGKNFIKYLLKNFEAGGLPDLGLSGDILMDKLGSLRAGQAIFSIIVQADAEQGALLLAQIERERYAIRNS